MSSLPLLTGAEAVFVERTIDGENAVEMIHLVLEELRQRAAGFERFLSTVIAHVLQANGLGALEPDQQIRKRETVVPKLEFLLAFEGPLGVDETVGRAAELEVNHTLEYADLYRADSAAEAVRALEFVQRVAEILEDRSGGTKILDRARHLSQQRITELEDAARRHSSIVFGER